MEEKCIGCVLEQCFKALFGSLQCFLIPLLGGDVSSHAQNPEWIVLGIEQEGDGAFGPDGRSVFPNELGFQSERCLGLGSEFRGIDFIFAGFFDFHAEDFFNRLKRRGAQDFFQRQV